MLKRTNFYKLLLSLCLVLTIWGTAEAQSGCHFRTGDDVTFAVSGATGENQNFVLTNAAGIIQYSTTSLPFTGVATGQYFAYVVEYESTGTAPNLAAGQDINNLSGTACTDISDPLPIGVCDCNNTSGTISFSLAGQSTGANETQLFVLTDENGDIISTHASSPIAGLSSGIYNVYSVIYDNTLAAPTLSGGTNILAIGGGCVEISNPLGFVVSMPTATLTPTASTCSSGTEQNNGMITWTSDTDATHYGISTAGAATYNGPAFASATAAPADGTVILSNGAHAGATYIVRVFDGANCFDDVSVVIPAGPICACPAVAPPASGTLICENATAMLTATGDANCNELRWYNASTGGTLLFTGATYTTPMLSTTTSYYVACFNTASACESSRTEVTVTVNPNPTMSGGSVCVGQMITLTGSGTPNGTNPYMSDNTIVATVTSGGVVTGEAAGTANITYTDDNGCTVSAVVTVNANPTMSGGSVCVGQMITLTGSGTPNGTNPYVSGNTAVATVTSGGVVTGQAAGTANITYTDDNGCTVSAVVTVNSNPTISAAASCDAGNTTYSIAVTLTNADMLTSSPEGTATDNGGGSWTVSGITVGTNVTLTAMNTSTTCSTMQAVSSPNCACPAVAPTASGTSICENATAMLTATGDVNCNELRWYNASTGGTLLFTGATYTTPMLSTTTSYYVACFNTASACESSRTEVTVTVNPNPTMSGGSVCVGQMITLTGSGTPNGTNPYVSDNTAVATVSSGGVVTGEAAGTANITYTDNNGCTVSAAVTVNANPTMSGGSVCVGQVITLTGSGTPNGTNPYVSDNTAVATVTSGGVVTGQAAGTANITYTDDNGCTVSAVVTVNPNPTISAAASCDAGNTTYSIAVTLTNADMLTSSPEGTATDNGGGSWTVSGITVGTNVTLIAMNTSTTCSTMQAVSSPNCACPAVAPTAPGTLICENATAMLTATGDANCNELRWYNASTGGTLLFTGATYTTPMLSTTTSYYVACFNTASACESSRTEVTVTVNPNPTMSGGSVCVDQMITLTGSGTPNGTNPYVSDNTTVATVSSGGVVTGEAAGTANITYTDNNGCTVSAVVTVTVCSGMTYSLGSTIFEDGNNNGYQDSGESGIGLVQVELYNGLGTLIDIGTDGILGTADDNMGLPYYADANGDYFFQELPAGDYQVVIPTAAFGAGEPLETINISSTPTDTNDNEEDSDDNGSQIGGAGTIISSPIITLGEADGEPTGTAESGQGGTDDDANDALGDMTVDFGVFAPVSLGDTTWVDLDMNGLQDTSEPSLAGVTVTLYNADGTPVIVDAEGNPYTNVTTTNGDGFYEFTNLPPGDYYVVFDITTAAGSEFYDFTTNTGGDDTNDSDADPTTGQSDNTGAIPSGGIVSDLDAGVVCTVSAEAGTGQTNCSSATVDLTSLGASFTPMGVTGFGATWTTSGSGTFDDGVGEFGTATTYMPSQEDIDAGNVVLTLTTDDPSVAPFNVLGCGSASDDVLIIILKVDCGSFPWDGN